MTTERYLKNIMVIVISILSVFPILFIEEKKDLEVENKSTEKFGITQILKEIFPLYGFLVFGVFSVFNHFFEQLTPFHNPILISALAYSVIIGFWLIIKGLKSISDKN